MFFFYLLFYPYQYCKSKCEVGEQILVLLLFWFSLWTQQYPHFLSLGHLPVHPKATDPICLLWNFDEVLAVIRSHSSVVCFMAGHDHDGGYHLDEDTGIHHVTFEGVIETPPDSSASGIMSVYEDRMELKGSGRVADRILVFPQHCGSWHRKKVGEVIFLVEQRFPHSSTLTFLYMQGNLQCKTHDRNDAIWKNIFTCRTWMNLFVGTFFF